MKKLKNKNKTKKRKESEHRILLLLLWIVFNIIKMQKWILFILLLFLYSFSLYFKILYYN
jgi:hypothetical protein